MDEQQALTTLENLESEGRAAFVILGGTAHSPASYRSRLESAWQQALNGSTVGTDILSEAYGVSAVAFAASNYRARTASEVPAMVADPDGNPAAWSPIIPFLPNLPGLVWYIEMGLQIWGVSYLRKWYNVFDYPIALEWMHPDDVNVQTDIKGNPEFYYIDGVRYTTRQIVELRTFDPSRSLNGKSEFEVALARVTTEQSIVRHAGSFFFNSARPDGMLVSKTRLNPGEREKAEKRWKEFKGSKNEWKTFVSGSDWEWIPITSAPVDLAMPELSQTVKRDICTIMGVNPALIGVADVADPLSAGATFKEIQRNHVENTTLPRVNWIFQHLNEQWLYSDFDDKDYYSLTVDRAAMPILSDVTQDRSTIAVQLTNPATPVFDYDEARGLMNIPPRAAGSYFTRAPSEANSVWQGTGMRLDEYRAFIGLEPLGGETGMLWRLTDGRLVRETDLTALAAKSLEDAAAPSNPFGMSLDYNPAKVQQPPPFVSLPPDKVRVRTVRKTHTESNGCAVLLSFAGNAQLAAVQTLLRARIDGGESFYWHTPDEFHITLLACERLDPDAERKLYGLMEKAPKLALEFDKVAAFPAKTDEDETPVYMAVKAGTEGLASLMEFQRALYERAAESGAVLSPFSNPDDWTPHVTLYYATGEHEPPTLDTLISCIPSEYVFSRDSYEVTQAYPAPLPEPPADPARALDMDSLLKLAEIVGRNSRPDMTRARQAVIEFAGLWPDNNFILMSQRMASLALQEAGFTAVNWLSNSGGWALPLVSLKGNPADASRMILSINLGDTPRLDLIAERFAVRGGMIGLQLAESDMLAKVRGALELEIEGAGYEPDAAENWTAFIPLGEIDGEIPAEGLAALDEANARLGFPLVMSEVKLLIDGSARTGWELRTASAAQLAELNQWKRKATGRRGVRAAFDTLALKGTLAEAYIRQALAGVDEADKDGVNGIFARGQKILVDGLDYADDLDPTPDEYKSYWQRFDDLDDDIGRVWLDYMNRAEPDVISTLSDDIQVDSVLALLNAQRDKLLAAWVGTEEQPGTLTKIVLAGMAAGNEALIHESSMNPAGRAQNFEGDIGASIDWTLLSQEALNFARKYSYELIRGIDGTTQDKVQKAFESWIQSGEPLAGLKSRLTPIFNDEARAAQIAQTESIRVYNEGAFDRWRQVGVTKAVWRTVRDPKVCPICRPLNGQISEIESGWVHPGGSYVDTYDNSLVAGEQFRGKVFKASAHTGCRCFRRPIVESSPAVTPPPKPAEVVQKTRMSGQNIDAVLARADKESAELFAKLQKGKAAKGLAKARQALEDLEKNKTEGLRAARKAYEDYPGWGDDPEGAALRKQLDREIMRYSGERDRQLDKIKKAQEKYRAETLAAFKADAPTSVYVYTQHSNIPLTAKIVDPKIDKARTFLSEILDGNEFNKPLTTRLRVSTDPQERAAYYFNMDEVVIKMSETTDTIIHEIGHALEHKHPDIHARAVEFLLKRRGNEQPVKMNDAIPGGGYDDHEITYTDNFNHPYEGKVYLKVGLDAATADLTDPANYRSSELISMGIQNLFNDAEGFRQRDPEYFNFIYAIIRRLT